MAFSEFYANASTGSNANGGDDAGAPSFTSAIGTWDGTSVYTTTMTTGVVVGQFANVGGSYVARVVSIVLNTSITLSTTAKSGTAPGAGVTTMNVGGVWKGPNGATGFPFNFITVALTNAAGDFPRVNLKGGTNYSITAAVTHTTIGPIKFQGYTTTVGDGGRATIDGGTSGASYILLSVTGAQCAIDDIIAQNNGATGSASGIEVNAAGITIRRVVVNNVRGIGLRLQGNSGMIECEAYTCNVSNTNLCGGILLASTSSYAKRCIAHDNSGSLNNGFVLSGGFVEDCIADSNGLHGILVNQGAGFESITGCDSYSNAGAGISIGSGNSQETVHIENCNLVKNGTYGIVGTGTGAKTGYISNCGFGSGTQANTSGQTSALSAIDVVGSITYAADVTPWVDPANGDFRISLAAAKGTGRGAFTQTAASYAGTVGYPDVGAAQHLEAAAGAVGRITGARSIGTY